MNGTFMHYFIRLGLVAALFAPLAMAQVLTLTPNALTFDVTVGSGDPPDQAFRIDSGSPGHTFTARVRSGLINPSFLTLFPTNGQTPADVTVSVDSSGFVNGGVINATIDVTNNTTGQMGAVQVTIRVFPSANQPAAGVTPAQLSFNAATAASTPPSKQLTIRNSGGGVLAYDLAIVYPSGPRGWLAVTPLNGTLSANTRIHQVGVAPAGLQEGSYGAQIILSGNGSNTPLVVPVTLTVGGPPEPATLSATPTSLFFTVPEGAAPPPARLVEIRNTGGGTASYELQVSAGAEQWLSVDPMAGSVADAPFIHTVSVDTTTLLPGSYTSNLILTSSVLDAPLLIPVSLQIPSPGIIFTQPASLDFVGRQGMPLRERRSVGILNEPLGPGRWSATVTSRNTPWLKVSPSEGELPGRIIVEIDTTGIGASTLDATIGIAATRGSAALSAEGGPVEQEVVTANLPVRLTLFSDGPRLSATPTALRLQAPAAGDPASQLLLVDNIGGPQLNWSSTVETDSGGNWLSLSPASGTAPTETLVTANPAGQQPGAYHGRIRLGAGPQSFIVPVVMVVGGDGPIVETDFSAAYWEAVEGRPAIATADFQAVNLGETQQTWTVQASDFTGAAAWASAAPSAGSTAPGASSGFSLTPRTQGLPPGLYGALAAVDANEPSARRWVTAMLKVAGANEAVPATLKPAGMLLESAAGAAAAPRQLGVWRNREGRADFLAGASTFDGGDWLSVSPSEGTTSALGATTLEVSADPSGLAPGVYRGLAGVSFGDGVVDSAFVTLAVKSTAECTADSIYIAPLSPRLGFVARVGRAVRLEAALIDNCGDPVENAAVLALFNSGDPGLPLKPLGGGRYTSTWAPLAAQGQANVILRAQIGPFRDSIHVIGFIDGGAATVISRFGVVNGASFRGGEAIAPGEIISVFGRDLTDGRQFQAESIPLATTLGDSTLRVGPVAAPFYFAGPTQLNVQAPFELTPGTTTQLVARSGVSYSTPVEVAVGAARPGVFSLLPGDPERAIVQNQDNSLNGPTNPAARGEAIVAYVSGAGAVEPALATGAAAPAAEPLARVKGATTATIGGAEAEILYFGMTPGFVGLAQINMIVPEFAPVGSNVPLLLTIDGEPSNRLSVAIEAGP